MPDAAWQQRDDPSGSIAEVDLGREVDDDGQAAGQVIDLQVGGAVRSFG
jgi:hypothetical protein